MHGYRTINKYTPETAPILHNYGVHGVYEKQRPSQEREFKFNFQLLSLNLGDIIVE